MTITSSSNDRIKHARRVRDGTEKDLIFVEGLRLVEECQRSPVNIEACFHAPMPGERMVAVLVSLAARGVPCLPVEPKVLNSLSDTVTTQGIVVIARRPMRSLDQALRGDSPPLLLGLERVQDPGNVGTLIRTAEAAGVSGILLRPGCADPYAPKTLRSAMGSAFRLPIMEWQEQDDLTGLTAVAAAGSGEMTHYEYDWQQPTLLWLGNEGAGLSDDLMAKAQARVRIPLRAGVESLNVAAAGAAMLFEAVRQRLV